MRAHRLISFFFAALILGSCARALDRNETQDALLAMSLFYIASLPVVACGTYGPAQSVNSGPGKNTSYALASPGGVLEGSSYTNLAGCRPSSYSSTGSKSTAGNMGYGFGGWLNSFTLNGQSGSFSYNNDLYLTQLVDPCYNLVGSNTVVNLNYDSQDRLIASSTTVPMHCNTPALPAATSATNTTINYNGSSPRAASAVTGGVTTTFAYTLSGSGQVTQFTATAASSKTDTFTYDSYGRITVDSCASAAAICGPIPATTYIVNFAYDSAGHVTSISSAAPAFTITFSFDGNGNLTQWTGPFGGAATTYSFSN